MEEVTLSFYEKIVKIFFLKKEFSDYLSPVRDMLGVNIAKDKGTIDQLVKATVDSIDKNKGIEVASFMYRNPNFFEFREGRIASFLGVNYIFSIASEAKNAFLYMQRLGGEDTYCKNFVLNDPGRYNDFLEYIFFFRNLFFLSALVFRQGTSTEKNGWNLLLQNNDYNILGFVLAKAKEARKEIEENIKNFMNSCLDIQGIFKNSSRYDKYSEFSQCARDISVIRVNEVLSNGKNVGCDYKMSEFNCYGDIFYSAVFERENSFSRNFFPPIVKISMAGEIVSENINFERLGNTKLTRKNREFANQIIMNKIKDIFGEKINKRIDAMYSAIVSFYPDKDENSNILLGKIELMYSSMKRLNENFNSVLTNACFMK